VVGEGTVRGRLVCEPSLAAYVRSLNRSVLATRAFSSIRLGYLIKTAYLIRRRILWPLRCRIADKGAALRGLSHVT
jgi:hypothetical protein